MTLTSRDRPACAQRAIHLRLNPERHSREIGQITRKVIDRLPGAGADLDIIIDISARIPGDLTEAEVRTIGENARALKSDPSGMGLAVE